MSSEPDANEARQRQPHAPKDLETRVKKAEKIVRLVGKSRFDRAARLLEIGCGSGGIAARLSELGGDDLQVDAVDVVDERVVTADYSFQLVDSVRLPYEDAQFDIVVTNHVIEHVGGLVRQLEHLREVRRVLDPGGVVYFAFPNKWRLVEPHYRLPLLSWLPRRIADAWVRSTGRNTFYDCTPLSHGMALRLCERAGFDVTEMTRPALDATAEIEWRSRAFRRLARALPSWLYALAMPIMPTYVFLLRPRHS